MVIGLYDIFTYFTMAFKILRKTKTQLYAAVQKHVFVSVLLIVDL